MNQGVEERIQKEELANHAQERLTQWLRDAHAMEAQAETLLTQQAERMANYPELGTALERHLKETRKHAELIEGCIQRRGGTVSGWKDAAARTLATLQTLVGFFTTDEIVKGTMAGYVFEHFEISAYRAICAAADELGDKETSQVCESVIAEEMAMAAIFEKHLDSETRKFLRRETSGRHAKN